MASNDDSRLDRIEEKIDKLSEAMIQFARAEEKLISIERNNQNQTDRVNRLSQKMDHMQEQLNDQARTVQAFNKIFWIVVVAAATAIVSQVANF